MTPRFRIDTYDNGKRTKTRGNLTDVVTDKRLTSEMAAAINERFRIAAMWKARDQGIE